MIDQSLIVKLCEQGRQILGEIGPLIERWQKTLVPESQELDAVFRGLHTIKGGFAFFGMQNIKNLTHGMEDVLSDIREMIVNLTAEQADVLYRSVAILRDLLDAEWESDEHDLSDIFAELGVHIVGDVDSGFDDEMSDEWPIQPNHEQCQHADRLGRELYRITIYPRSDVEDMGLTMLDMNDMLVAMGNPMRVRVGMQDIGGLDDCLDVNMCYQLIFMSKVSAEDLALTLDIPAEQVESLKGEQSQVRGALMVDDGKNIKFLLQSMAEVVSDLAQRLQKTVRTQVLVEDCLLDPLQRLELQGALIHLVRNAIDHGIEFREQRASVGKPSEGLISFSMQVTDEQCIVAIEDDGGGINNDTIITRAIERGLIAESTAVSNDQEVYDLLFQPGFSTCDSVSEISGRGVGLDVVRHNIEHIGGHIHVRSEYGKGSCISIVLPRSADIQRQLT